jgi:RimJ/RimL family protein N-acetyltransferase
VAYPVIQVLAFPLYSDSFLHQSSMELEFDLQPRLHGRLLELRPLRPDDFEALFAAASDPLIWEHHPEHDRYKREVFKRFFEGAIKSGGALVVIDRKSGRIIGSSRYCNLNPARREAEIGWTFLERPYWGGAYNGELKQLMLEHAFQFVDRVLFVVGKDNIRSQQALKKIGAKAIGEKKVTARDGTEIHCVIFQIARTSQFP